MTKRDELIAALESAGGPSRELDEAIESYVNKSANVISGVIPYTASIDAALTLIPDGWELKIIELVKNRAAENSRPYKFYRTFLRKLSGLDFVDLVHSDIKLSIILAALKAEQDNGQSRQSKGTHHE